MRYAVLALLIAGCGGDEATGSKGQESQRSQTQYLVDSTVCGGDTAPGAPAWKLADLPACAGVVQRIEACCATAPTHGRTATACAEKVVGELAGACDGSMVDDPLVPTLCAIARCN